MNAKVLIDALLNTWVNYWNLRFKIALAHIRSQVLTVSQSLCIALHFFASGAFLYSAGAVGTAKATYIYVKSMSICLFTVCLLTQILQHWQKAIFCPLQDKGRH